MYRPFEVGYFANLTSATNVLASQKNGASHTKSETSPLVGLVPAFALWIMTALYLYLQPIILHQHLIPFMFYIGLINAYMVGKIIIAHLTKSPHFPYRHSLMFPLAFGIADSIGPTLGLWPSALGYLPDRVHVCLLGSRSGHLRKLRGKLTLAVWNWSIR